MKSFSGKRSLRKLSWVVVIGAVALALAWFALTLYAQSAISGVVHTSLSQWLEVQASVSGVDVDLLRGRVGLYGLRVAQPEGFGKDDLVYAAEVETAIRLRSLLSGTLDILEISIAKLELDVRTDDEGQNSLKKLADTVQAKMADDDATADPWAGPVKALHIRALSAVNGTAFFRESMETKDRFEIAVADIAVHASNLRWGRQTAGGADQRGLVKATGQLRQRPFSYGRCGIALNTGAPTNASPALNVHGRFVGIELANFASLLPANTAAILGGDALDLSVDMSIDDGSLTGQAIIETIAGYRYDVKLSGTPAEPNLTTDHGAVAYVLSRTQGGFANFFSNLGGAGQGAGGAVADGATDLAQGTIKAVGSFGQGLWQTAKGAVTFDADDLGQGTKTMGSSLAGGAKDAVFGAGGQIVEGVGDVSHSLDGGKAADKWRNAIPKRWTNAWQDAVDSVRNASVTGADDHDP